MGTKAEHFKELDQSDAEADSPGYDSDDQQARFKTKAASKKTGKAAATKAKSAAKGRRATFDAFAKGSDSDEDDSNAEDSEEGEEDIDEAMTEVDTDNNSMGHSDPRFQLDMSDDDDDDNQLGYAGDEGDMDALEDNEDKTEDSGKKKSKKDKRKKVQPLTPEELAKFQAAHEKTGIVYISRIPPFMKPIKIRHLLSQFGEIGRVYLAAEDAKIAARRKKYGGNKKQNFTEGWIEFKDKTVAKTVARTLNTTIIGGKKNSHYHDDIWNIKYLPKFKWNHLTERIAYENASRAQRLQAEINQAKRENKAILANIEKSKMIQSMEEKKAAKRKAEDMTVGKAATAAAADDKDKLANIRRAFKQRKLDADSSAKPAEGKMKSVLSSVFGR